MKQLGYVGFSPRGSELFYRNDELTECAIEELQKRGWTITPVMKYCEPAKTAQEALAEHLASGTGFTARNSIEQAHNAFMAGWEAAQGMPQQAAITPTDEQINDLLGTLDTLASKYDQYEYGLPTHDFETAEAMRKEVRTLLSQLAEEREEDTYVINRLATILADVAIALKGPELPRHRHGYHDLAEVASVLRLERDLLKMQNEELLAASAVEPRTFVSGPSGDSCVAAPKVGAAVPADLGAREQKCEHGMLLCGLCGNSAAASQGAPKEADPVAKVIYCPECGCQHIDTGEWATRPHKTHQCQHCKHEWRPFEYATVGVAAVAQQEAAQPELDALKTKLIAIFKSATSLPEYRVYALADEVTDVLYAAPISQQASRNAVLEAARFAVCRDLCHGESNEHGDFVMVQLPTPQGIAFRSTEDAFVAAIDAAMKSAQQDSKEQGK